MPLIPVARRAALLIAALAAPAVAAPPAKKPAATPSPANKERVTRAEVKAEAKRVFDMADTNHDGFMSHAEFRVRMGAVLNRTPPGAPGAPTKEGAKRLLDAADAAFKAVDTNGDGKLSLTEASARPLAAFDTMDANHDGIVTRAERMAARGAGAPPVAGDKGARLDPGR